MFQFACPNCQMVLQADAAQANQQCQCPGCGNLFLIPAPAAAAPQVPDFGNPFPNAPQGEPMGSPPVGGPAAPAIAPQSGPAFPDVQGPAADGRQAFDPYGEVTQQVFHISCPNGHELEVPPEMLNEEVMCPHCGSQFLLRERDSVEYKRKKEEDEERRQIKAGKQWFTAAVIIASVVVIALILMMIFAVSGAA